MGPESHSALSQQRWGRAQPGAARAVAFRLVLDCPLRPRLRTEAGDTHCQCLPAGVLRRERAAWVFMALDCRGSWPAERPLFIRSRHLQIVTVSTALGFGENSHGTCEGVGVSWRSR